MGAICGGVLKEQSANRLGRRIRKDNTRDTRKSPIEERASIQSSKRKRDWEDVDDTTMNADSDQVIRVARRVWVGNLSFTSSWQDLKDYFSRVGSVKFADVLREGGPGSRSKGCGIVEFETPEEAAAAIQQLNHTELNGRQIFVREDREDFELRGADGPKRLRGGGGGGSAVSIGRRVWAGNLNAASTWKDLKDHFKTAGKVLHADIMVDSEGRSKGCGIVEFEHPADALRAISLLSNSILNDRQIMVREDREDPGARGIHPAAPPRRSVGFGGFGGGGGAPVGHPPAPEGTQVVVHGIHYRMAWQDLKDLCRAAGPVVRADVMTNPDGTSKGYGVVVFTSQRDADNAISMLNGLEVEGRVLTCKYDRFASGRSYQD